MKLLRKKRGETSATITQTLILILACSTLFALTAYASAPGWWTSSGAVNSSLTRDDNAAVNEGQLKQFTARAVAEMNAHLSGGAGSDLNGIVSGWAAEYAAYGYNSSNLKPSDYEVMRVGQIKYIGNKLWAQLVSRGYASIGPTWLAQNTSSDNQAANIGQLKSVFNFDLTASPFAATPTLSSSAGTYGSPQVVTVTSSTPGATIYYTLDGSTPTTDSLSIASGGTITIPANATLQTMAVVPGDNYSLLTSTAFTISSSSTPPTTGLAIWFKADSGVTSGGAAPVDGGIVDTWTNSAPADTTGAYNVAQSNSDNQPTYVANDLNGKPGLRFNGYQWLTSTAQVTGMNADMTMITVGVTPVPSSWQYALFLGANAYPDVNRSLAYSSGNEFFDCGYVWYGGGAAASADSYTMEATSVNSTVSQGTFYQNGNKLSTPGILGYISPPSSGTFHDLSLDSPRSPASSGTPSPGVTVGAETLGQNPWQGDILEQFVYSRQLSDTEMQNIEIYLGYKYGLFYNVAPTISPTPTGPYTSTQSVTISSPQTNYIIHYTLDGSTPTVNSPVYTGSAIAVSASALVQAALFYNGQISSPVASTQYYVNDSGSTGLPDVATSLTATSVAATENDLSWSLGSFVNYSAISIYRSAGGGAYVLVATLDPSATSYADQNVVAGTTYTYEVGTSNQSGISYSSASSGVTSSAGTTLTITVTTPSGVTYLP